MSAIGSAPPSQIQRSSPSTNRLLALLAPIASALVGGVIAFQRLPTGTRRTIWAEDGQVFLQDALRGHYNLFEVNAGYLHVLPRAAALVVVNLLDFRKYALGINISACVLTGLVVAVVYICAEDLVPSKLLRAWLALTTVLLPVLGVEVLANLANVHSLMMWGAFWALLYRPRTLVAAAALAFFMLLAALTEVQSMYLVPLGLLLLWRERTLRRALVVAGCVLGAASQLLASLTHERERYPHLLGLSIMLELLGAQIAMPLWLVNNVGIRALIIAHGWWLTLAAALPLMIGFGLSLRYGDTDQRIAACSAVGLGLLIFCSSHMLNLAVMGGPDYSVLEHAPLLFRYAVTPSLLFLSTLAIGTAGAQRQGKRLPIWLGAGAIAVLLIGPFKEFRSTENERDPETSWTRQVREASSACRAAVQTEHEFRISPKEPWHVLVPCSQID